MATYFVKTGGSDVADGLSDGNAWETVAKVNGVAFSAADTIQFNRGDTWRETLTPTASGTSGSEITFSAYGTGDLPIINGADIEVAGNWSSESGNVYKAAYTTPANCEDMVWEDGVRLNEQSSVANVEANAGSFWADSGQMYVHPVGSTNPGDGNEVYEFTARTYNVDDNEQDYLIFENFHTIRTWGDDTTLGGIFCRGTSNIVQTCTSNDHRRHGVAFYVSATNCVLQDSSISDSVETFPVSIHGSSSFPNTGSIVRRNTFGDGAFVGVTVHGNDTTGTVIEQNLMSVGSAGSGIPINIYDAGTTGATVRHNYVTGSNGVRCVKLYGSTSDHSVYGNILDASGAFTAVLVDAASNCRIYNNTVIGNGSNYAIRIQNGSSTVVLANNACRAQRPVQVKAGASTGFSSDYNQYHNPSGTVLLDWEGSATNFATWKTNSSQDANSAEGDPLFTDPGSDDFTLQSGSPCDDNGTDLGDDFDDCLSDSSTWPSGVAFVDQDADGWDIGAFVRFVRFQRTIPQQTTLSPMGTPGMLYEGFSEKEESVVVAARTQDPTLFRRPGNVTPRLPLELGELTWDELEALGWDQLSLMEAGGAGERYSRPARADTTFLRPGRTSPRSPVAWDTLTWDELEALTWDQKEAMEFAGGDGGSDNNSGGFQRPTPTFRQRD